MAKTKYSLKSVKASMDSAGESGKQSIAPLTSMDRAKAALKDPKEWLKTGTAAQTSMGVKALTAGVTDPKDVDNKILGTIGSEAQKQQIKDEQAKAAALKAEQDAAAAAAVAEEQRKRATDSGYGVPGGAFDPTKYIQTPQRSYAAQIGDSAKDITTTGPALDAAGNDPRAAQARLLALLENAAQGNGPSAAQAQLQAGKDANIKAMMSMAASGRGGANPAAMRTAIMGAGSANQQAANQAAQLRAQEMQAAYGLMGQTASGIRGQDTDIAMANQAKQLDAAKFGISAEDAIRQSQLQAALAGRGQDLGYHTNSNQLGVYQSEVLPMEREKIRNARTKDQQGSVSSGIGSMIAAVAASDERLKTDIEDMSKDDIKEFLAAVNPKFYKYKDEAYGSGTYPGYMAQDLEKSKVGKALVKDTPQGKMIDLHAMQGAQLGVMKYLVDALEAKKGK